MTALEQARLDVEEALRRYWECVRAEEEEYAEDYERVTFMEYEAPAPDPCAEAFSRLVAAVRAYEKASRRPGPGRAEEPGLRGPGQGVGLGPASLEVMGLLVSEAEEKTHRLLEGVPHLGGLVGVGAQHHPDPELPGPL